MVVFGGPELREWFKCGNDRIFPTAGFIDTLNEPLGHRLFVVVLVKNSRAVASADIVALAV